MVNQVDNIWKITNVLGQAGFNLNLRNLSWGGAGLGLTVCQFCQVWKHPNPNPNLNLTQPVAIPKLEGWLCDPSCA